MYPMHSNAARLWPGVFVGYGSFVRTDVNPLSTDGYQNQKDIRRRSVGAQHTGGRQKLLRAVRPGESNARRGRISFVRVCPSCARVVSEESGPEIVNSRLLGSDLSCPAPRWRPEWRCIRAVI